MVGCFQGTLFRIVACLIQELEHPHPSWRGIFERFGRVIAPVFAVQPPDVLRLFWHPWLL